eukprot:scaffold158886_cov47-Attheya_sp.AAC.1
MVAIIGFGKEEDVHCIPTRKVPIPKDRQREARAEASRLVDAIRIPTVFRSEHVAVRRNNRNNRSIGVDRVKWNSCLCVLFANIELNKYMTSYELPIDYK